MILQFKFKNVVLFLWSRVYYIYMISGMSHSLIFSDLAVFASHKEDKEVRVRSSDSQTAQKITRITRNNAMMIEWDPNVDIWECSNNRRDVKRKSHNLYKSFEAATRWLLIKLNYYQRKQLNKYLRNWIKRGLHTYFQHKYDNLNLLFMKLR